MIIVSMDPVYAARSGELEQLAKYLEDGGYITEEIVEFLVSHLRGEIKWKRGNKRTYSQYLKDISLAMEVWNISLAEKVSTTKAQEIYCERNDANYETVKSACKRAQKPGPMYS